jgi:hypothetical protein
MSGVDNRWTSCPRLLPVSTTDLGNVSLQGFPVPIDIVTTASARGGQNTSSERIHFAPLPCPDVINDIIIVN